MKTSFSLVGVLAVSLLSSSAGYTIPGPSAASRTFRSAESATTSMQMSANEVPDPSTFREAEILGLRLMQEGNFDQALVGTLFRGGTTDTTTFVYDYLTVPGFRVFELL
jgi:hypothetical protein